MKKKSNKIFFNLLILISFCINAHATEIKTETETENKNNIILHRINTINEYNAIKNELQNKVYDKPLDESEEELISDTLQAMKMMFEPHGMVGEHTRN